MHPEDRPRAQEATAKSLKDGVLPPVDCRLIRPDGSIRHTTSTSSMLFDAAGVPRRIVGAVLDRTESLAVEAVLFITGYSEEATRAELSHPVLAKPVSMPALIQAVHERARRNP